MKDVRRDFAHRVVSMALILRLVSIMVALLGMVGETMTGPMLGSVLMLSLASLAVLLYPSVAGFVMRHPIVVVSDLLTTLAVIAALGVESPLVLATLSTALIIGVIFDRRAAFPSVVVLVAGYLLVAEMHPVPRRGFMVALGVPAIFVFLVAVGSAVRGAHEQQVSADRLVAGAREVAAASDERSRLAREMHDSLGKTLHGIALAAAMLPTWVESDPTRAAHEAGGLAVGAQHAAVQARQLLVRMRADQPERPLADVLVDQCAGWEREYGVTCELTCQGAVDLSADARYELLAMVGESLENAGRHSGASRVDVVLSGCPDGSVQISIDDDGCGFAPLPDGRSPSGHFGLTGMRERAAEAGASLVVESNPGQGTRIEIRYPSKERSDTLD